MDIYLVGDKRKRTESTNQKDNGETNKKLKADEGKTKEEVIEEEDEEIKEAEEQEKEQNREQQEDKTAAHVMYVKRRGYIWWNWISVVQSLRK